MASMAFASFVGLAALVSAASDKNTEAAYWVAIAGKTLFDLLPNPHQSKVAARLSTSTHWKSVLPQAWRCFGATLTMNWDSGMIHCSCVGIISSLLIENYFITASC